MTKKTSEENPRTRRTILTETGRIVTGLRWAAAFAIERTIGDEGCQHAADIFLGIQALEAFHGDRGRVDVELSDAYARIAELNQQIDRLQRKLSAAATPLPIASKKRPAVADSAPTGEASRACREHDWDTSKTPPVCKVCGKAKSNRGRKSASNPSANVAVATVDGVTKIDPPSLPLPRVAKKTSGVSVELSDGRVIDDLEEDPFEGGTVGAR